MSQQQRKLQWLYGRLLQKRSHSLKALQVARTYFTQRDEYQMYRLKMQVQ